MFGGAFLTLDSVAGDPPINSTISHLGELQQIKINYYNLHKYITQEILSFLISTAQTGAVVVDMAGLIQTNITLMKLQGQHGKKPFIQKIVCTNLLA